MIGIRTVYKSNNCGSFWQAYCLQEAIKEFHIDCAMIEYNPPVRLSPGFYEIKHIIVSFIKMRPKIARGLITKWKRFIRDRKRFFPKVITEKECDFIIIGSDTLWNVHDYYFNKMISYYTCNDIKTKPFSVFATSAGQASSDDLMRYNVYFKHLLDAKHIFVRDIQTSMALKRIIGIEPNIVCDPTLLFDRSFYFKLIDKNMHGFKSQKYILLYVFGDISKENTQQIIEVSNKLNCNIISLDKKIKWVDCVVPAGPIEFISYFSEADYVFTDTFHGTVFSTIFEKQFVVLDNKKTKIHNYLESLSLINRVVETENPVGEIVERSIDYSLVSSLINDFRQNSINKLGDVLEQWLI